MKKKVLIKQVFISVSLFFLILIAFSNHTMAVDKYSDEQAEDDGLAVEGDPGTIINTVIRYATTILAGLFVLMMLIGSIMYMVYTDTEKKQKGIVLIQSAIIAAIIALLSYALWKLIQNVLVNTGDGGGGSNPAIR